MRCWYWCAFVVCLSFCVYVKHSFCVCSTMNNAKVSMASESWYHSYHPPCLLWFFCWSVLNVLIAALKWSLAVSVWCTEVLKVVHATKFPKKHFVMFWRPSWKKLLKKRKELFFSSLRRGLTRGNEPCLFPLFLKALGEHLSSASRCSPAHPSVLFFFFN